MKLLNEIVSLLMDENGSLNEIFLKTKVLLYEIGQGELTGWVTSELTGYAVGSELAPYRKLYAQVYGTITNGYYSYQKRVLSVSHLREEHGDKFEVANMRQPIGVLETYVADSAPDSSMTVQFDPWIDRLMSRPYKDGYYVEGSYSSIGIGQVRQILIEVRSRLLDFVLELRSELGVTASQEDIKERVDTLNVPGMFGRAVFGDNATIVVGDNNWQQISNAVAKNDKAALVAELRKNGISDEDIKALNEALNQDPVPAVAGQYGPEVQGWMKRMLGRAVDATWNIPVGAAGSLLATALQKYYGI